MRRCFLPLPLALLAITAGTPFLAGCRESQPSSRKASAAKQQAVLPEWFARNQLGDAPTAFLRRHASAPVHWQPWTKETTAVAKESRRLLFTLVGSSLYPTTETTLAILHNSPRVVANLNQGPAIPVLIDAEANREVARLVSILAAEIRKPVAFPFLMWLSPEGNPVAWIPADRPDTQNILDLFDQSHSMVTSMWDESPEYVVENSAKDAELRTTRIAGAGDSTPASPDHVTLTKALTRLCDLFDSGNGEIDGSGGLFPSGTLEFLGSGASSVAVAGPLRQRAAEVAGACAETLLRSPALDPLDGGISLARRGTGWGLPLFIRDTSTQARAAVGFINVWRATGQPECLEAALAALRFADTGLGTAARQPIHSITCPRGGDTAFLWTLEDLEQQLTPGELAVFTPAMDIRGLGNIPPENDPDREFFRLNALKWAKPPATVATALGLAPESVTASLDSARRKLLKARSDRTSRLATETTLYSRNLARLVSAHAAAFAATNDDSHLRQARALAETLRRDYFKADSGLLQIKATADAAYTDGRALDYALAIHAAIDLHNVTLDPSWIQWCQELVDLANSRFVRAKRLLECAPEVSPADFPVSDSSMLFEESSVGLFSGALARLSVFQRSAPPDLQEAILRQCAVNPESPITQTDLLSTAAARHLHPVIRIPDEPATIERFLPVLSSLGPRLACIATLPPDDSRQSVTVEFPGSGGTEVAADSPEQLREILASPQPAKP